MLTGRVLAQADLASVLDVRCGAPRSGWSEPELGDACALVLVRRGCFLRRVDGFSQLIDPASAYFQRPGDEQQVAHPCDGGDACTVIHLDERVLEDEPPRHPLFTSRGADLAHRRLLRACREPVDTFDLEERALALVGMVLDRVRSRSVSHAQRRAVDDARALLNERPAAKLTEVAHAVALSPSHLSRVFRAVTAETLTRYRNRVRVRVALDRLAEGEESLARLAAELGFADHAHLTRLVRAETGSPPSRLRDAL